MENDNRIIREVNLKAKRTELGWSINLQLFLEEALPLWFKWIGWVFATGALAYLAQQTGSIILKVLEILSTAGLSLYLFFFILSIKIEPYSSWIRKERSKIKKIIFFVIGIIVFIGSYQLIDAALLHTLKLIKESKIK